MDTIDRKILAELQRDGRQTITELSGRVGLSLSPCQRRLRELEHSGAISGYRAVVDAKAVGCGFQALVFITVTSSAHGVMAEFEAALQPIPYVVDAQRLFGEVDYLLRVVAPDLPSYQRVYDKHLSTLPGVQRINTTLVMSEVVHSRPLPIGVSV